MKTKGNLDPVDLFGPLPDWPLLIRSRILDSMEIWVIPDDWPDPVPGPTITHSELRALIGGKVTPGGPEMNPIPEALCTLKPVPEGPGLRRRIVNLWVIEACPYCGRRHTHGAGIDGVDDPRQALGHRVAHCVTKDGKMHTGPGYVLVERPGEARPSARRPT